MLDTTSKAKPSETLRAHPSLMRTFELGHLSLAECERRARGAERLKERFSCVPFYAQKAMNDPDYWSKFYDSRINW